MPSTIVRFPEPGPFGELLPLLEQAAVDAAKVIAAITATSFFEDTISTSPSVVHALLRADLKTVDATSLIGQASVQVVAASLPGVRIH
jgi:hypothetical protein